MDRGRRSHAGRAPDGEGGGLATAAGERGFWPPAFSARETPGAIRDPDEERRYWHQVGIAARARVHRELIAEGEEFCPICEEALRA